jgi:hypothetical protein
MVWPYYILIVSFCLVTLTLTMTRATDEHRPTLRREEEVALRRQLAKVAGVYQDGALVNKYQLEKTVLVTGCNHGYLNHLFNFDCFAQRLAMKYLIITMDDRAESYIHANAPHLTTFPLLGKHDIGPAPTTFRTSQFNLITARKMAAVLAILQSGYDVLFSDTDVAIVRDPFPYLIWKHVDYVHSLNEHCQISTVYDSFWENPNMEGNTGFYFVRSSAKSIRLWTETLAACAKNPSLDDQSIFWKVLRNASHPSVHSLGLCRDDVSAASTAASKDIFTSCILDTCLFNSGALSRIHPEHFVYETVLEHLAELNASVVTIHANFMVGNRKKQQRMQEHKIWLTNSPTLTCNAYEPLAANWNFSHVSHR